MGISNNIKQLPWKEFLKNQIVKVIGILIMIFMVLYIIQLSAQLTPDRNQLNPDNIIGFNNSIYWSLIITSSVLFIFVVLVFTKLILFDNKEEFGIESFKSFKSILIFFLVVTFLCAVYLLLDSSLVNIYLVIGPVDVVWILHNRLGLNVPGLTGNVDRLAYAQIRSLWFFGFYIIMILFPILMFIIILTRIGRKKLFVKEETEPKQKSDTLIITRICIFLFTPFVEIFVFFLLVSNIGQTFMFLILLAIFLVLLFWWIYNLLILLFKTVKFTAWFSYGNFLLISPIILIFYVLPVVLWTVWDMAKIYVSNSIVETIHDHIVQSDLHSITYLPISTYSIQDQLTIIIKTLIFNATPFDHSIYRILQLDFVIIVGLSAIIIGLAEGYSIVAILKALTKGVSIAKTGKIATQSSPKLIVMTSRLLMLGVWMSLIWDKFISLFNIVKEEFPSIHLPDINFLPITAYLYQITNNLLRFSEFLLPLAILLLPLFLIFMSSFKFLSVTIVIEKVKGDIELFFLLMSSAFVLIVTQILGDITSSFTNDPGQIKFMPFAFATQSNLLPWATKVFENLEAGAFYIGVFIALIVGLKEIKEYLQKRNRGSKDVNDSAVNSI
ncbi:MAG: hypothetical protein ACFFD1_01580 [Candidatus Thorarchaeota archaeon]